MISLLYDICMEKMDHKFHSPTKRRTKKQQSKIPEFSTSSSSIHKLGWYAPIEGLAVTESCRLSTKVALSTTRKLWHFPNKKGDIFCIYPLPSG